MSDESVCLLFFFESEIRTSVFDGGCVRNKKMQGEVHEGNDKIIIIIIFLCLSEGREMSEPGENEKMREDE